MGRPDKRERQERRAGEEIDRALGRHDAERAVTALLAIPREQRELLVPRVAAAYRGAVLQAQADGAWSRLVFWAARAEQEPRLLAAAGGEAEDWTVHWALFWGAVRCREWKRADLLWSTLSGKAVGPAPALAQAIGALLAGHGTVAEAAIAGLPAALLAPSTQEPPRPRPMLAPPDSAEQAEAAVLRCHVAQPFNELASTVQRWAVRASPSVAAAVRATTARLALRELLASVLGKRPWAAAEAGRLFAGMVIDSGAPNEFAAGALLAFRLWARRPEDAGLQAAAMAATAYAEHRTVVVGWLTQQSFDARSRPLALSMAERLVRMPEKTAPALWAKAFHLWASGHAGPTEAPSWLVEGLERALRDRRAVAEWARDAAFKDLGNAVGPAVEALPPPLAERLLDAAWELADETKRERIANEFEVLLDRVRSTAAIVRRIAQGKVDEDDFFDRAMESFGEDEDGPLPPAALLLWRRWEDRLVPISIDFLEIALREAQSFNARCTLVHAHLAGRSGIEAYLKAFDVMSCPDGKRLEAHYHARMLERFALDVPSLARAFRRFLGDHGPSKLVADLASALLEADDARPGPRTEHEQMAIAMARRLTRRGRPKPPARPRKRKKSKSKSKSKSNTAHPSGQIELPGFGVSSDES